jgi:ATP-dependent DNA ligase
MYHPDEGFAFYSRNISVQDYLPVCYTSQVLLIKDNKVRTPQSFKGKYARSFVLDAEVIVENKEIDTTFAKSTGVVTGSELNAVSAILSINTEASHKIQMEQAPLKFKIFDIMHYDGKDITNLSLRTRKQAQGKIMEILTKELPFEESVGEIENKKDFYEEILKAGGEGNRN